jgi:hypothetical protein
MLAKKVIFAPGIATALLSLRPLQGLAKLEKADTKQTQKTKNQQNQRFLETWNRYIYI